MENKDVLIVAVVAIVALFFLTFKSNQFSNIDTSGEAFVSSAPSNQQPSTSYVKSARCVVPDVSCVDVVGPERVFAECTVVPTDTGSDIVYYRFTRPCVGDSTAEVWIKSVDASVYSGVAKNKYPLGRSYRGGFLATYNDNPVLPNGVQISDSVVITTYDSDEARCNCEEPESQSG